MGISGLSPGQTVSTFLSAFSQYLLSHVERCRDHALSNDLNKCSTSEMREVWDSMRVFKLTIMSRERVKRFLLFLFQLLNNT